MQKQRNPIHKYHNKPVVTPEGEKFDSKKEYRRWKELQLLERAGEISSLMRQVAFELIPAAPPQFKRPIRYVADFVYIDEKENHLVVEDVKGVQTPVYKLKKRLMFDRFGILIREV